MGRKVKIQLYSKDKSKEQILNSFGDYVLDDICTSCSVEEDLYTTEYFLDAEFIIDEKGLYKYIEEDAVLKVQVDYGQEIFSIADVRKTPNRIIVFARQITITESICTWLDDVRPEKKNGQDALNHMIDNAIGQHNIEFESDISVENTAFYVDKTLYDALHITDNCFAIRWGGEVRRRGYKIIINEELGGESDVQIRSGRNLTGFEATTNIDNVVTRIIPKGFNGITTDEPIDSPLLDIYKYVRTQIMEYNHVKLREDLNEGSEPDEKDLIYDSLAEAQIKLEELALMEYLEGIDKLRADYTINFIDLSKTEEYKEYAKAEIIQLGEEVNVYEEKHNINIKVRAIKKSYDVLNQGVIEITLSNYNINEEDQKTADAIEAVKSRLDQIVEDIGYMNITYAKIEDVEIMEADIKKLQADIADIENLEAVNARIENLEANKANITDLEVAVADIVSLKAKDAEIENLVAQKATIENLNATNAEITNLKAKNAEIENLVSQKATIENLNATNAEITNLKAKDAEIEEIVSNIITVDNLDAVNAEIDNLKAIDADIMDLMAEKASVKDLNATNAKIVDLQAKDAEIENIVADVITTEDLSAIYAEIMDVQAEVIKVNDLLGGNLSSENIGTLKLVAEGAVINDATIATIDAGTITSGTINTSLLRIEDTSLGSNAGMIIYKSKQVFYDKNGIPRMQLGLDNKGDFSLILKKSAGDEGVLLTEEGIQSGAFIGDRIISDNHISGNANIDGSKLNIGTVIDGINEDNSTYLKSNKIYLDDEQQTLDIQFKSLTNRVNTIENVTVDGDLSSVIEQVNTNTTAIEIAQGNINTLIQQTTITKEDGTTTSIQNAFSETRQEVDSLSSQVSSLNTNYNKFTGEIDSISNKQTTMEQTLDGFTATVEDVNTRIDNAETKINTVEQKTTSTAISNTVRSFVYSKDEIDHLIDTTKEDVTEGIGEQYATQDDITTLKESSASQLVQTSKDFTMKFTETKEFTQEVQDELISYKEEVATNIRFSEEGIELGKSNSPFKTVLDNEKLAFIENGAEVAYISNQKMNITNAEVEEELKMGQFCWTNINGHLRLRKG